MRIAFFQCQCPLLLNVLTMRLPTGSLRQALLTEPNCPNILPGYEVLIQLRHSPHRCIYGAGECSFSDISWKSNWIMIDKKTSPKNIIIYGWFQRYQLAFVFRVQFVYFLNFGSLKSRRWNWQNMKVNFAHLTKMPRICVVGSVAE